MNFKQPEHEHVAQYWERMKMMLRNCPTHGLNLRMIIQNFYAGLNFVMKGQFSGTPNEDDASHLNTSVELCDMQNKKICVQ